MLRKCLGSLIFTKRFRDVFDDELNRIAQKVGSRAKAFIACEHALDEKMKRRSITKYGTRQ